MERFKARILAGYFLARVALKCGRANAPELPCAEKTVTAGVATVGRKTEPALQRDHRASFHALARNMFEIEVPAPWTMRVALIYSCHAPAVKAAIAGVASPGP